MSYIGRSAKLSRKAQEKVSFLATAGQTVATGLAYVPTFVEVILNGSTLTDVTDYTATDGNSITFLGDPLTLNDEVTIISLKTFALADHYNKSEADALLAPLASPTLTGTLTADKVVVQDEVEFEGHTGNNALIQKNSGTGRDELQIYSAGDANSTGSRGAGVHLYGNNDNEHAGNVAFITGQNDAGAARMIISGGSANASNPAHRTNTDTRVTIGNNIWNYVDVGDDTALLTLKNPSGVPALYITDASASEGDITVGDGESMQLGHWNGTTFTERMKINSAGVVTKPYQPAFHVYDNGGGLEVQTTTTIVPFSVAELNTGNHFNFSTNQFNAPVSGMYCFSGHAYFYASTDYNRMFIKVNSATKGYLIEGANSESHTSIVSTTCYLNAGDTAQMELQSNDGNIYYRSSIHTYFTGHLIG